MYAMPIVGGEIPRTWCWMRGVDTERKVDFQNEHLAGLVEIAWRVDCNYSTCVTWDWEWY